VSSILWNRFVRFFFYLLYGPFAWTYDLVAWLVSMGQWNAWAATAMDELEGSTVLELGHGPGHLQVRLAGRGWRAVGVDPSPQMVRLARRRLLRAGLPLRLVRARAQALPFCDRAFQSVVATFPTEYILDRRTRDEMVRVLRPGGRIVVVAAAQFTGRDPVSRFLEWLYRITGQREPLPREGDPIWREGGVEWETRWIPARRSRVLMLVGSVKQPSEEGPAP